MPWHNWVRDVEIEPSLYAADFSILGTQVERLLDAGARVFHFDVGDGRFVEPVTMGPIVLRSIADAIHARGAHVDCHLMVVEPERQIPQLAAAGGDSVTFHVEAAADPAGAIALAREHGLGVGVAFRPDTEVERAIEAAAGVDFVLCMSIHPGYSGQRFMPSSLERLARLRAALPDETLVQVDGGIDSSNVGDVAAAGAHLVVSGSAIFEPPDIVRAYVRLCELAEGAIGEGVSEATG